MPQKRNRRRGSRIMTTSYASGPADNQALPSFRELLPPHLHEEIESTSYYLARQQRERPSSSSHDLAPSNFRLDRDSPYSRTMVNSDPRDHAHAHLSAADATSRQSSRPSPMLPPIRDLQSYAEPRGLPRPDLSRPVHGHGPGPGYHSAPNMPGPLDRGMDAYRAPMHGQIGYQYSPMAYQSDPDHAAQALNHHQPQSNFGILGDPVSSSNRRRRGNLPKPVTDILKAWFQAHLDHPYPSEEDKQTIMTRTGLTINQISNWFINARRRQLPAMRNQARNGGMERQSPLSDMDTTSEPSPHRA
ncbi:homeobox KN domain-containing protein [Aspergillus unguis]